MDKLYEVISIDQMVKPGELGGVDKFYRIRFKTKGGIRDYLDLGEKDYTEGKVTEALTKLSTKHDKILAL